MRVTLQGVLEARAYVYRHLHPTPLIHYPILSRSLGCQAYVKHENHNPTGSFKVRGGINLIANLSSEERRRGVITATRGNHGQSVALASKLYGVTCTVAVPEGNSAEKNDAMQALGAQLLIHGRDFDEAREKVEEIFGREGTRYVHSANEPMLVHGVGTYALEILEEATGSRLYLCSVGGWKRSCRCSHSGASHGTLSQSDWGSGRESSCGLHLLEKRGDGNDEFFRDHGRWPGDTSPFRVDLFHHPGAGRRDRDRDRGRA